MGMVLVFSIRQYMGDCQFLSGGRSGARVSRLAAAVQEATKKHFVIQEHSRGTCVHWDFMLEAGDHLATWRLDAHPADIADQPVTAVKIFDHEGRFLTYEGPVNKGQGQVKIVESGTFLVTNTDDTVIDMTLSGRILKGNFKLKRVSGDNWRLFSCL